MRVMLALSLSCAAGLALAEGVPKPRPKPVQESGTVPLPRQKPIQELDAVPLPRPKPVQAASLSRRLEAQAPPAPQADGTWPASEVAAARAECTRLLDGLDLLWQPEPPLGQPGGCGTPAPIAVNEIAGVRLDPPATLSCAMAAGLHGWIGGAVQPAARELLGAPVTEIANASSYVCRRRNNASSGKMSEHAFANALDIGAFRLAKGDPVSVAEDNSGILSPLGPSDRGGFLKRIRAEACAYFNTVLGPGEAGHGDHFHLDLMQRKPGRFKMCH